MSEYDTGNPVPSASMLDAWDNMQSIDKFVNSSDETITTRTGEQLDTLHSVNVKADNQLTQQQADFETSQEERDAVVEETRQNLIPLSRQYMTLAAAQADIANIPVGSTTYVRSQDGSTLAIEVINTSGTLQPTGRQMPSTKTVDDKINERLVPGEYRPGYFPAFFDRNGMVPAWFDGGKFDVAGLGPNVTQVVSEIPNEWAQKFIPQGDFSPYYFPFLYDQQGNVYAWFNGGLFDAPGLGPVLQEYVKNLVSGGEVDAVRSFIEGDQYKFLFKNSRIFAGQSTSLNIAFTGDSWTEKNTIPQSLINILGGTYKDPGWISCSNRTDGVMSGISPVTATNFTKYDGGSNNTNIPPYGCGPDGNGYYNNNTVGSLVWTGVTVTNLSVFYYDGSGTFTITIDSNAPVTITGGEYRDCQEV